jgi:hypothetical protein
MICLFAGKADVIGVEDHVDEDAGDNGLQEVYFGGMHQHLEHGYQVVELGQGGLVGV